MNGITTRTCYEWNHNAIRECSDKFPVDLRIIIPSQDSSLILKNNWSGYLIKIMFVRICCSGTWKRRKRDIIANRRCYGATEK
jgi:hypothetical protein